MKTSLIFFFLFITLNIFTIEYTGDKDKDNFIIKSQANDPSLRVLIIEYRYVILCPIKFINKKFIDNSNQDKIIRLNVSDLYDSINNKNIEIVSFNDKENNKWIIFFNTLPPPILGTLSLINDKKKIVFEELYDSIYGISFTSNENIFMLKGGYPKKYIYNIELKYENTYYEIKQEYYQINKKSIANTNLELKNLDGKIIGQVKKLEKITVIGIVKDNILIKNNELQGWIKLEYIKEIKTPDGFIQREANISFFNDVQY